MNASHRCPDLYNARVIAFFRQYALSSAQGSFHSMHALFSHVVNSTSPRFWVSPWRASVVVSQLLRGHDTAHMHPLKREMYQEIFSRFKNCRNARPDLSLSDIVSDIVLQPAPKFYMTIHSAKLLFYKHRNSWHRLRNR